MLAPSATANEQRGMQEGGGGRLGVDTCSFREAMSTLQRQWFRVVAASGAAACAFALFVDGAEANDYGVHCVSKTCVCVCVCAYFCVCVLQCVAGSRATLI